MLGACGCWVRRALRRLRRSESGSSTVEMVIALPMLIAVLAFATEYGRILQMQSAMEKSASDAAMALALLPLDQAACGFPNVDEHHLADTMIRTKMRVGNATESLTVAVNVVCGVGDGNFSTPFDRIEVTGAWQVGLPLIGFLNNFNGDAPDMASGFLINATVFARHVGRLS